MGTENDETTAERARYRHCVRIEFTTDADEFLALAGSYLTADPLLTTVVTTVAHSERGRPVPEWPRWFASVIDGDGNVVGAAMQTASFAPHPLYVLPMPDEAARLLGAMLTERGEVVTAVNGNRPSADLVAATIAASRGAVVSVGMHLRLFEVHNLVRPPAVTGHARAATSDDLSMILAWSHQFHRDAEAQGGRDPDGPYHGPTEGEVQRQLDRFSFWEADGRPVSMAAVRTAYRVGRIGPVYTPTADRGRGFASALTAHVTAGVLDGGDRCCLFTDQANPTSNALYERLGYEAVTDTVNLLLG